MARCSGRQVIQALARFDVVGQRVIEVGTVGFRPQQWQQCVDRGTNIADQAKIEPAAPPKILRSDINLGDGGVSREELAVGEVRPQHQQPVAILHRMEAGGEADQPGHPHVVGILPLNMLLAAQRVYDGRLQHLRQLHQLVVRAGAAPAAEQRNPLPLVEQRRQRRQIAIRGPSDRGGGQQAGRGRRLRLRRQ